MAQEQQATLERLSQNDTALTAYKYETEKRFEEIEANLQKVNQEITDFD